MSLFFFFSFISQIYCISQCYICFSTVNSHLCSNRVTFSSSFQPTYIHPFFHIFIFAALRLCCLILSCISPTPIHFIIYLSYEFPLNTAILYLLIVLSILFKTHPSGKQFRKLSKQHTGVLAGFSEETATTPSCLLVFTCLSSAWL